MKYPYKFKTRDGLELFFQAGTDGEPGYIRFAIGDEMVGSIDRNEKLKLKKIKKFVDAALRLK